MPVSITHFRKENNLPVIFCPRCFVSSTENYISVSFFDFQLQILLMLSIMVTGNYNFFNLLYIGLCLSVMDDSWLEESPEPPSKSFSNSVLSRLRSSLNRLVFVSLAVATAFYFIRVDRETFGVEMKPKFGQEEFDLMVR